MLLSVASRQHAVLRSAVLRGAMISRPAFVSHSSLALSGDNVDQLGSGGNSKDHVVVALGGNAMLKRKQAMTMENQRQNIRKGMESLKNIIAQNTVTMVHGNGPQVGLLALQSAAYENQTPGAERMELDVLDAESEGQIGYLLEQEIQPFLDQTNSQQGGGRGMATILSQILVDKDDPAFQNPTKFIGPVLTKEEASKLTCPVKADGDYFRRVVPSPLPVKMLDNQFQAVQKLTKEGCLVICAGGGGIPCIELDSDDDEGHSGKDRLVRYQGIEAVIDKDRAACMMGLDLNANVLLILTDVNAVSLDFGTPQEKRIKRVSPGMLKTLSHHFPDGSMGPKVESVIDFVEKSSAKNGWAAIGSLQEADKIIAGEAGTLIQQSEDGEDFIEFYGEEAPIPPYIYAAMTAMCAPIGVPLVGV